MKIEVQRKEGYELLHQGSIALAMVEANGIRIDLRRLERTKARLKLRVHELREELSKSEIWHVWKKRFGEGANLGSRDQLATILHDELGFKVVDTTESGRPSTDEEALRKIDHASIPMLLRLTKYEKALRTFLRGIESEIVGDRIHPVFNLHTVRTYRSSSDSPNFQNFPVRDKEISKIIRSLFIPSPGCVLVENDFKGIEVALAACYHHDPVFISYITTPGKDMHRDMAAQIYKLKPDQVDKDIRYGAKNMFVFPQFYGDFYVSCARSLWEWIDRGHLKGPDGDSLRNHLKREGIIKLGGCDPETEPELYTFEYHLKQIENDFWNRRFKVYGKWRRDWYEAYLSRGYFDLLTGFRVHGMFNRNAVTNYPIQGSAFHCLLWSLIQVNRILQKEQMRARLVGQIHDSLIADVPVEELRDYLEIVEQVTTGDLRRHYTWLVVPPQIEYELCPLSGNWFKKREVKFKHGRFGHPDHEDKWTRDADKFLATLD